MNNQIFNFSVIPSVVKADEVSRITIRPLGENAAFKPELTYKLSVRAFDTACRHYDGLNTAVYEVSPDQNGDLVFEHRFCGEQRHVIMLTRPEVDMRSMYYEINNHRVRYHENARVTLGVYSLYPDLYGMRAFRGEVHCHTFESDGIQDALHTVGNYRNAGYDFLAITDHFTSYASEKAMRVFKDAPVSMTLLHGEEVHTPTERIHVVQMGGRESINDWFRNHRDECFARVEEIKKDLDLPETIDPDDYAWRLFIAEKAREFDGLSILAHPFWIWSEVYFMPVEATKKLLRDGVYDALDLLDDDMEVAVANWADLRAEGIRIPIVGSTDSHRTNPDNPAIVERGGYTVVLAPDVSRESILSAIRDGRSLCVSTKTDPEFVYGSMRHVKFVRFLLDHFFPVFNKLCWGQGTVMSEYPLTGEPDETSVKLLAELNRRSDRFADEFYGYK